MKKIFYILIIFILQCGISNLNSQWVFQNSGTTQHLYDIFFIDKNTGWACGNNSTVLNTTNGGTNWYPQFAGTYTGKPLKSIFFVNQNIGYVAGWFETWLKTTNGGNNWTTIRDGTYGQGNSYNDLWFINETTGWICGFLGNVQKTTDGGISWDSILIGGTGSKIRNIKFINENTGFLSGDGGMFYKSINGGLNWTRYNLGTFEDLSMDFVSTNVGWCVGLTYNYIYKTIDGGLNWVLLDSLLPNGNFQNSYCIKFVDSLKGWVGGTFGRIFATSNGGLTWINEDYDSLGFVNNFSFYKDSLGWCSGGGGKIKQKDIFIGIENISTEIPIDFKLLQNYPNPFNPKTTIEFEIPKRGHVAIKIYNILGKEISIIVNEALLPGKYKTMFNGENLSSGIYFCILYSDKTRISKKMSLIK